VSPRHIGYRGWLLRRQGLVERVGESPQSIKTRYRRLHDLNTDPNQQSFAFD
jgi:hypothetical protein